MNCLGYVHCDLKPANILWTSTGQRVALADFGACQKIGSAPAHICCTANYRPPELWEGRKSYIKGGLQPSIDIWSFGCLQWELVIGKGRLFFPSAEKEGLQHLIESFALSHRTESFAAWIRRIQSAGNWANILQSCLKPMARHRPKAVELLKEVHNLSG